VAWKMIHLAGDAVETHAHLQADVTDFDHALVSADHTASGLTAGHVLRASSATAFGFVEDSRTLTMGRAGTIPAATANDQADFLVVVPWNLTLTALRVSCATKPSSDTTVALRRSTDGGNSFSSVSGFTVSITAAGTSKTGSATPTASDVSAGDVLSFSVTVGGGTGTNVMLEVIGRLR
jgi:hypothetical protein